MPSKTIKACNNVSENSKTSENEGTGRDEQKIEHLALKKKKTVINVSYVDRPFKDDEDDHKEEEIKSEETNSD